MRGRAEHFLENPPRKVVHRRLPMVEYARILTGHRCAPRTRRQECMCFSDNPLRMFTGIGSAGASPSQDASARRCGAGLRRGEASPPPPKTGRIGEARRGNSLLGREKRTFFSARFTTWPFAPVKRMRRCKSRCRKELAHTRKSCSQNHVVKRRSSRHRAPTRSVDRRAVRRIALESDPNMVTARGARLLRGCGALRAPTTWRTAGRD